MFYTFHDGKIDISISAEIRNKSIGDFLETYDQSRKNIYLLFQNHALYLDGTPLHQREDRLDGKLLTVVIPAEMPDWPASEKECQIIYEDDFVYIVHKAPGLIIHNHEDPLNCLNAQASRYQIDHHIDAPVRPIHRLDEDTCGLVLYCKMPFFQPWLDAQLKEKKIHRCYLAIVYGTLPKGKQFAVHEKIGRDRHQSGKYRVSSTGKDALTYFKVIACRNGYSLIQCTLETGRTHQIRVHLAWTGHPIVNDKLYGTRSKHFQNMGLWAYKLEFNQPITLKRYKVLDVHNKDFEYFEEVDTDEI